MLTAYLARSSTRARIRRAVILASDGCLTYHHDLAAHRARPAPGDKEGAPFTRRALPLRSRGHLLTTPGWPLVPGCGGAAMAAGD